MRIHGISSVAGWFERLATLLRGAPALVAALVASALALASCATDTTPHDPARAEPPASLASVSGTIGPEGGTLSHPSGARIVVPAGALPSPTLLTLTGVAAPSAASFGGTPLGQGFRAGPDGQTFAKPVDVVVPFDPTRLPTGASTESVQVFMKPRDASAFFAVQSTVDFAQRVVHASALRVMDIVPGVDPSPVFITSSFALPQATIGVPYTQPLEATGGVDPYTWSVSAGSVLPPGLALSASGTLSGSPTLPSAFAFFVTATDHVAHAVQAVFTLTVVPPTSPLPVLAHIAPASAAQGSAAQALSVTGSGFVPSSTVLVDGAPIATTFVNDGALSAAIPASALATAGTRQISVRSPAPGGGTSSSLAFTVRPVTPNPVPHVTAVAPTAIPITTVDTEVILTGTDFTASTSGTLGTTELPTQFVSSTELRVIVPALFLASAGSLEIGAKTPPPGGGDSATRATVTVGNVNPVPTLASLSPSTAIAGASVVTVTASGTSFVSGGRLFFGVIALATTVLDDHTATATVPGDLLSSTGTFAITFVSPTPGGGASTSLPFTITASSDDGGAGDAGNGDAGNGAAPRATCSRRFGPPDLSSNPVSVHGTASFGTSTVVVGRADDRVDFGNGATPAAAGAFVVVYDASCAYVRGGNVDTSIFDFVSVAADANGNVFAGGSDMNLSAVVFKLDATGAIAWKSTFVAARDYPSRVDLTTVVVDDGGGVWAFGSFQGNVDFGGTHASRDAYTGFGVRLASDGTTQAFAYVGGTLFHAAVSRSGRIGEVIMPATGFGFTVAVLDANGDVWSRQIPAPAYNGVVAFDDQDNLFLSGLTTGSVDFGGGPLVAANDYDAFVAKYDASGNHVFSKVFAATGAGTPGGLVRASGADAHGNVYVTGPFAGTIDFGSGPIVGTKSFSLPAVFVAKLDGAGNAVWARSIAATPYPGADAYMDVWGLTVDAQGVLSLAGRFSNVLDFGVGPMTASSSIDGFTVRFAP